MKLGIKFIAAASVGVLALCAIAFKPQWQELIGSQSVDLTSAPSTQMRLMNESQYRNTIESVFETDLKIVGQFEPDMRQEGLAAVGSSQTSIGATGYERYYAMAGRIAKQVTSTENWSQNMACSSSEQTKYDENCARSIIKTYGEKLYRRQWTDQEIDLWVKVGQTAMGHEGQFNHAMASVLEGMLSSPEFLFVIDSVQENDGEISQLTGYAKAARLSYLLWNSSPDQALLDAAAQGELETKAGLKIQVDRLLASPNFHNGARAFFEDFLHLSNFKTLEKDRIIYPSFTNQVANDAKEQILRYMDYHLIEKQKPYPSIFTETETFVTRPLGAIYGLPVTVKTGWEKVKFSDKDPRAGLMSHIGFMALHAHPGRSSATLRGIAVREVLLCQTVEPAPAAVNFTVVQDTENPIYKTARARLTQHRTDEACKSCHAYIDPIGLAFETFDGVGKYRTTENGEAIDTSGNLDGVEFADETGLEHAVANHAGAQACLVQRLHSYATGRPATRWDRPWISRLNNGFNRSDHSVTKLIRSIALSKEFYAINLPAVSSAKQHAKNKITTKDEL